jgi:hypothetical protein
LLCKTVGMAGVCGANAENAFGFSFFPLSAQYSHRDGPIIGPIIRLSDNR